METQGSPIWIDGKLVDWSEASVHFVSNSFQYGFGVFEGIRAYEGEAGTSIFRLDAHIDRLFNSAKIIGLDIPYGRDEIIEACCETVAASGYTQCYLRPVAYIGYGGMGLSYGDCRVSVGIATWYWGEYLGQGKLEQGIRVKTSSYTRHHINSNMSKAKACGNYMLFQMARTDALRDGYDEALLLDSQGHVAEGSVENVFIVRNGALITPPLTYILDGITRDSIIALARSQRLEVREEFFTRDAMYTADEAFFVGTGAEITPVIALDNRLIGRGTPGPLTRQLQSLYFETVRGRNKRFGHWVTPVSRAMA
ncbi:branched-chain amino acid transaminase [uncultured Pigmentiphaga sp.]|jgi:branched-chain amino acid aminotransferase, group I|uniref:branched-chain amino acid transaminase n=1 Tax=uncultured Pigmentiphaga sp. TaxID=340361 RepID=UPI002603514C|nr:branched-chain amino acid transaminase [uncultured Pigmentiphaga sp.]